MQQTVRDFVTREVKPVADRLDKVADFSARFPWDILDKASCMGLRTTALSVENGGNDIGTLASCIIGEELGAGDLGVSTLIGQNWSVTSLIERLGTDYHREMFLEPFLADKRLTFAVAQSEPQAGTDKSVPTDCPGTGIMPSAVMDGVEVVLNGVKHFISGGATAKAYLVLACTDKTVGWYRGTTAFLVPADVPGVQVGHVEDCWGQRLCPVAELIFDDCRIAKENQFTPRDGATLFLHRHANDGLTVRAAHFVGIAREAYERSLAYAQERVQGGKPIIEHQLVAERIGRMYAEIEKVRLVVWKAACNATSENYNPRYQRLPRMLSQEMASAVALDALRIHGGPGTMTDVGIEKLVRDAITGLHPYPSDVHGWLLGEPTLIIRVPLHLNNARDIAAIEDIRPGGRAIEDGVIQRLQELGLEKGGIGLVGSGVILPNYTIPFEHHQKLAETFPRARFENVSAWFAELRFIKSEEELGFMEKAGELVSHAYEHMILSTRRGARHCDITAAVEILGAQLGACYPLMHFSSTPMADSSQNYPDPVPTYRTVEDGHVAMTELVMGLGSYTCKVMGTYFVGEPTGRYRDLFEVAASVYERTMSELKPGMTGRDTQRFLEPIRAAGYTTQGTLIMGWANYIERPSVGAPDGSLGALIQPPEDLDFVFKPGQCLYAVSRAATPDLQAGVWVGASCVFTGDGLRKLVKHPVSELRAV